jgi:hypothetical protein
MSNAVKYKDINDELLQRLWDNGNENLKEGEGDFIQRCVNFAMTQQINGKYEVSESHAKGFAMFVSGYLEGEYGRD